MARMSASGSFSSLSFSACPFGLDLAGELLGAGLVHEDLDARLVLVVAAAVEIVHAHDRRRVGEQVLLGQEVADLLGDHRRAALAAADIDGEAELALVVLLQMQADVVHLDRGAVALGAGHRDLELARQVGEFRMHRRPLAQDFGIGPRIGDLVGGGAGEMVGGDVADAVAEVWMACISTVARSARIAGMSDSAGQLNWMFWRVVKWP